MDHFRMAILEVCNLDLVVAMSALIRGLQVGGFFHSLSKRLLHDFLKLLSYFKKYGNKEKGEGRYKCLQENHSFPPQPKRRSDEARARRHSKSPHHHYE